jgi:diguanylate cyclase
MSDAHTHTVTLGEIALDQIRRRRFTAEPRNYEIWYTYAAGTHSDLNQTINESIARSGMLNQEDLDRIFEAYLSPLRMTDRIDGVSNRLVQEVDGLLATINDMAGSNADYSAHLDKASASLDTVQSEDSIRAVVEHLITATREVMDNNRKLEDRLTVARSEVDNLQRNLESVRAESYQDPLTTLSNRKHYDMMIQRAITLARATDAPLSLLVIDIDHFKRFNDTFGHLTGDQVLRLVGLSLKQNIKGNDIASRYGGEEFTVILPGTTLAGATSVADQIRRAVMSKELVKRSTGENLGRITISIGVALLNPNDDLRSVYERADQCLYAAKRGGRNMVVTETELDGIAQAVA